MHCIIALFILAFFPSLLRAQSVAVTFNIIPPYSAYVYDYADLNGQAVITLTNLTSQPIDARLEGILTNTTNGLFVRTNPGHRGPLPISLPPNGTVVLSTQPGVMDFLDPEVVTTNASAQDEQAIVQTGQLPEGLYRFCVEVYDYNGPQLLSVPNAGCTSFNLQYANPPLIVQPTNGQQLSPYLVNPVFTWTPPLGNLAGAMIQYELVVAPVFPGQDPNDAIIAARTYRRGQPVLVKQGLMNTVYVRQPSDLPFEQGKTYVMQVTARDVNNNVAISNLGRSEIHVFTVGEGLPVVSTPITPPTPAPSGTPWFVDATVPPVYTIQHLRGNLRYYWRKNRPFPVQEGTGMISLPDGTLPGGGGGNVMVQGGPVSGAGTSGGSSSGSGAGTTSGGTSTSGAFSSGSMGQFSGGNLGQVVMAPPSSGATANVSSSSVTVDGITLSALDNGNRSGYSAFLDMPLGGATVQLVQAIQFKGTVTMGPGAQLYGLLPGNIMPLPPGHQVHVPGTGWVSLPVLATTVTNADGSFIFNAPLVANMDFSWQTSPISVNGDHATAEFSGAIHSMGWRRVLMVHIAAPGHHYYAQPIQFAPGYPAGGDLGTFHAEVKHFDLTVRVNDVYDPALLKDGMEVLLMRRQNTRPSLVPKDELRPGDTAPRETITASGFTYEILGKAVTNADGYAAFKDLVRFDCASSGGNNRYYTHVRPEDQFNTTWSVSSVPKAVHYAFESDWKVSCVHGDLVSGHFNPQACERCTLATQSAHAIANAEHSKAYKPKVLHQIHHTMDANPRVVAQVKNAAAGTQTDLAMNEPGVGWFLYRLDEAAMQKARDVATGKRWGHGMESDEPWGMMTMMGYLSSHGTSMQLIRNGSTGNDGRIQANSLPVQNWSNPKGYFHVLYTTKAGFEARVRVVNKLQSVTDVTGDVGVTMPGRTYNLQEIIMHPKGMVKLRLINEQGQPVAGSAYWYDPATGQQGTIVSSSPPGITGAVMQVMGSDHFVTLNIPSGNNRRIVLVPNNTDNYDRDTIIVNVPGTGMLETDAVIPFKLHRIHFTVRVNTLAAIAPPIVGARIELMHTNAEMRSGIKHPNTLGSGLVPGASAAGHSRWTDNNGKADLVFKSSATEFTFRIYGPNNSEYVTRDVVITSEPGKHWSTVLVNMDQGRRVVGTVMLDSVVVPGAAVRYEHGGLQDEAITGADGTYELRRVPKDAQITFTCSKPGYAGMEFNEAQQASQVTSLFGVARFLPTISMAAPWGGEVETTTIDFRLSIYGGMDFSSLLGFPLEVTAFEELAPGQVRLNGWVTVRDSLNQVFRVTEASASGNTFRSVRFTQRTMVHDSRVNELDIPYPLPQQLPMPLHAATVHVGLYPTGAAPPYRYHGQLVAGGPGITLDRPGAGGDQRGAVLGELRLSTASFTDNNFQLPSGQGMRLRDDGPSGLHPPVFASDGAHYHPPANGHGVVALNGNALQYVLHGFQAQGLNPGTRLFRDSLVLDTRLHTALEHVPAPNDDLNVHIGTVRLSGGQLVALDRERNVNVPLGSFTMRMARISMNSSGIGFQGTLQAAGLELPVTAGRLEPTRLLPGHMPLDELSLMGVLPVAVHGTDAQFGFDATREMPAWYVVITSGNNHVAAASISGADLDGLADSDVVPITSIWLYSDGYQQVTLRSNIPTYRLYGITDFTLQNLFIGSLTLSLGGALDLGIPAFPAYNTAVLYPKQGNTLGNFQLQPFPMHPVAVNGVQLAFNKGNERGSYDQTGNSGSIAFGQGELTIRGVVSDQDPMVFKDLAYTLTKTNSLTRLTIDRAPQQSVRLGGDTPASRILVSDIEGEMTVVAASGGPQWNHLYIKGDMPPEMGFKPGPGGVKQRMRFEVMGDLQVQGQQVQLDDIDSPFSGINMVYDPINHRLSGQLTFSNSLPNGPSMNGTAAIVMDKTGYYFMAGLQLQLTSPVMNGMGMILLGDYAQRTPEMDALVFQYSMYSQRMIERRAPALAPMVMSMIGSNPTVALQMAQGNVGSPILPEGYTKLFNTGRFNGFFFTCGASIPFPGIPSFSIDCSPIVQVEFGLFVGSDVRFGANFGTGAFAVGFDHFMDYIMGQSVSNGVFCFYGRLGVYVTVTTEGFFQSSSNWQVSAGGDVSLTGMFRVAGGICSTPCDDITCLSVEVDGSIAMGFIASFGSSGADFRIVLHHNGTASTTFEPIQDILD